MTNERINESTGRKEEYIALFTLNLKVEDKYKYKVTSM